ncbi:mannitol 1-phosphate dehydrogenase [Colletotrichum chrysophilum]|uniref:Mannitol 1-phosphate dehydrogenase n=1 Tax=Colletotrichum chrysophilum TaxID=1836956 RepID=A0AAD9AWF5_9PEZI|nr:mannitol 1-phosphate dehydrogenase [Colletotrichum chrysophilum]
MGDNFEPRRVRVGIIGAGIAGCCLSIGLLSNPHLDVHLFEGHPNVRFRGFGLALHANAIKSMDLISPEIKKAYFKKSHFMANEENMEMATQFFLSAGKHAGTLVAELGRAKGRRTVHRAHFIEGLLEDDVMPKKRLHFGKRLVDIEGNAITKEVKVSFEDGTDDTFDVVFGAEGVFSPTRKFILGPEHPATKPVNHDEWRQFHSAIPMTRAKQIIPQHCIDNAIGYCTPYGFIIGIPVDLGQTYSIGCLQRDTKCPQKGTPFNPDLWKGFLPEIDALISAVEKSHNEDWSLQDHEHAPTYYKGHVAMLGDAAHATLPHAGNGAAQAIEDCSILAGIFNRLTSVDEIEPGLKAFDEIRRPRSQKVVDITREFGRLYSQDGDEIDLEHMRARMKEGGMFTNGVDMDAQVRAAVAAFERYSMEL